jgi:alkaline phosphatase
LPLPKQFKYVGGEAVWASLLYGTLPVADADGDGKPDRWTVVQSRAEFQKLISDPSPRRVIGVAETASTLQQARTGDAKAFPFTVPLNPQVPTLSEMTQGALNVLNHNPHGFFLMVEGGAVDWANHAHQSGRMIEEKVDFNHAVEAAAAWVEKNSSWNETLLLVTGDHESGYLTGSGSNPEIKPVVNQGKGKLPGMQWNSMGHTNTLIPLYVKGQGYRVFSRYAVRKDPVRGFYLDNTELAKALFELWSNQ